MEGRQVGVHPTGLNQRQMRQFDVQSSSLHSLYILQISIQSLNPDGFQVFYIRFVIDLGIHRESGKLFIYLLLVLNCGKVLRQGRPMFSHCSPNDQYSVIVAESIFFLDQFTVNSFWTSRFRLSLYFYSIKNQLHLEGILIWK